MHQPAAHTDGDTMVFFRGSDVIITGDVFVTTTYPMIDAANGGSLQGIINALNHVLRARRAEAQPGGRHRRSCPDTAGCARSTRCWSTATCW